MALLARSEAARKITQLFALERLALSEIAVAHPILAALQQVSPGTLYSIVYVCTHLIGWVWTRPGRPAAGQPLRCLVGFQPALAAKMQQG